MLGSFPQANNVVTRGETIATPVPQAVRLPTVNAPLVDASGPHLTRETHSLLRVRLRAAASILLVGFGVFLVRHVAGLVLGEPLDPVLLSVHIVVVAVLAWGSLPLCRREAVSMPNLRAAELAIFGLPAAFFLLLEHRVILTDAARGFMPPPLSFWLLLIFTYAMFIPNTWRRAAVVIGSMALAPELLVIGMLMYYPAVAAVTTAVDFVQHILVMAVAAVAAVFGAYMTSTLRREAFEARQLGQYRLIAPLGTGGMGEVYLAEHGMLKRPCAVKLIRPEKAGDPQALARFEREVQVTARLSHWNTIEIYDYGRTEDGTFYYVMEYLPGLSLADLMEQHGPLPAGRVIHLLRQACQALREAHASGLVHRDIKPGNIFASERGGVYDVVKLLDFGLVKSLTETVSARLTQDGAISGSPLFMSPEHANGLGETDARSDIYSLGAVAYALLGGRPPFVRRSALQIMFAHLHDEVVPLAQVCPNVPADLEQVVLNCLAKRPEDRFQNVESLEQALAACVAAGAWTQTDAACWWTQPSQPAGPKHETQPFGVRALVC